MGAIDMDVTAWLLDSDPAIRWQVLQDLIGASPQEVAAERAEVARTGWGRALLDRQVDGQWAGGACFPDRDWQPRVPIVGDREAQPWTATLPTLRLLRGYGADPADPHVVAAVAGVRDTCRWEYDGSRFFDGEVEPCINGQTVVIGSWFGQDVTGVVRRLLGEQLPDGGWNCEAENGSNRSSYHSTICVLEGLLAYERSVGEAVPGVAEARERGQEYLLQRRLMRRASTGELVDASWQEFSFPTQWYYDVLRGLEHFRAAGAAPDPRLAEAVDLVRSRRRPDGRWLLDTTHPGLAWFAMESDGQPSRWITLRALRVLQWWDAARAA